MFIGLHLLTTEPLSRSSQKIERRSKTLPGKLRLEDDNVELLAGLAHSRGMTSPESNVILAYWLVPSGPAEAFFFSRIGELSTRFDAPLFEAHVTVYAGRQGDENPEEVLRGALADCDPFRLLVRDIQCSDEFTKTVFVQFEPSRDLLRLNRALQQASALHDEYELNPHLSLIYKKMTREARMEVASSIRVPFTEVFFDSAKAIISPTPITSRADVEAWRVVATQSLTK